MEARVQVGRKNTKLNLKMTCSVKTRAQSNSENYTEICKFYGITHEIQIKLVKLKPAVPQSTSSMYKCHICGRNMRYRSKLKVHLQTHLEKTIFCSVGKCKYKCSIPKYLQVHVQRAHVPQKLKPFECKFCKWRTHLARNLKIHIRNLHNPDVTRFKCTKCNFTTAKPEMLNVHVFNQHRGPKPVQCSECAFRAVNKHLLARHWESIHKDQAKRVRPFKCPLPECSYAGHTAYILRFHMRNHTGKKPFKCKFCPYASTQRSNWKVHERIHTNQKPYACALCSFKCTTKCILDCHIRSHTGKRPFACSKCEYRASESGNLKTHFRRYHTPHGNLKEMECPLCQDKFYRRATLECHMTRHTGERHSMCRFCGLGLTHSRARNIHEKTCVIRKDESVQ